MPNPSKFLDRMEQCLKLLLKKPPPRKIIKAYYTSDCEELQQFCALHGPDWAMGISVIDAAQVLADGFITDGGFQSLNAYRNKISPPVTGDLNA
jgi:hypothetical protein